ncbi:putative ABC transporter permease [Candidatus Saccharibacteria bacterium]|nr:putative ABC transporter permease [Candidatus Saccharibacteria bacterium]MBR3122352.1 putative ABC transporter permease [Candidatus Saccharibacteria bacterium]
MSKKKTSFSEVWREYLDDKLKLEKWQKVGALLFMIVFAGFFGWTYEMIFYFFDGGTGEFYMQGGNFLPWINIYAIGAVLIVLSTWKFRKNPWAVFIISVIATGLLELIAGWLVYTIGNGTRYWDYNVEIWNFGNIGGFVCLRSVLVFGFSALLLMYLIVPGLFYLAMKLPKKVFMTVAILLFTLVMMDEVYNLLASKIFGWPNAVDFYQSMGWKYLVK